MKKLWGTGLLLILAALPLSSHATINLSDIQFENYSVADGLSQSSVLDIAEDHYGFIWFATGKGLNRFDGYTFHPYLPSAQDPHSLPDEIIRKLFVDKNGNLWVGTQNGLARYNAQTDSFIRYEKDASNHPISTIGAIDEGPNGEVWVADSTRLYAYDANKDRFDMVILEGQSTFKDVRAILNDDEYVWVGTYGNGLYLYEKKTGTLVNLSAENPWNINITPSFIDDIKKIDGKYWLATEQGAYVLNHDFSVIKHLHVGAEHAISGNQVKTIAYDKNGYVWLGSSEGLSIYSIASSEILNIDKSNDVLVSLQSRYLFKIFQDSKGSIWAGSFAAGVHKYNSDTSYIKHFEPIPQSNVSVSDGVIWAFAESDDNKLWIATQSDGLNLFSPTNGKFQHYSEIYSSSIWDLAIDKKQRLWLATERGILLYQKRQKDALLPLAHLLKDQLVDNIYMTDERAWFWSVGTLSWFDTEDLSLHTVPVQGKEEALIKPALVDSKNTLWILVEDSILLFDLATQRFTELSLKAKNATQPLLRPSAVIEANGSYYVSTQSSGIFKLDGDSYQIIAHISETSGLSDNTTFTTLAQGEFLWVATAKGIDRIDLNSDKVSYHISEYELDFNELNEGAGLVTSDGKVLFGGADGFHILNPTRINSLSPPLAPAPLITKISIFNREINIQDLGSPLSGSVFLSREITLPNNASQFSFDFALVNPKNPLSVSYRYQMQGLSEQWLDADPNIRQATFTNLGFGTYTFRVQARELNGPWSPTKELTVKIAPPKWLHHYALVAYGIVGFLILGYWLRQYELRKLTQRKVKESEERLKLTLWGSGDELWDWDINQGDVFRSNLWGIMDFPQDNLRVITELESNIHPVDLQRVRQQLQEHLQGDSEFFESTYRVKDFRGNWLWVLDRGKVVAWNPHKKPARMTGTLKNISHLKQAEEQLRLFQRSIETISDGVFITNTQFRIISVNKAYCKHTGDSKEQALASYLTFHQYPPAFTDEVRKTLAQKGNWSGEVEAMRRNGERYEIDLNIDAIQGEDGTTTHYVGVFSDITSRKKTEKDLLQLANTDTLTGLPNRSFFQASHKNLVRKGSPHALLCMDMDNFKKINDSMGHQTGDLLIKQIAARLQKFADATATCYRLGGDEFSLLVEGKMDIHRITHLAQRILDEMARPFTINHQEFVLGGSLGITFFPEDGNTPQELLKNADTAMYFAKNNGGNRYQFFSGEMNQNAVRQLQIENLIRHGIKEELFSVYYQPKVDIASGQLVSMEALVRFEHPEKGIVSPAQFIPLAEETGQIIDIGEIVLRKACEDTQRWVKQGLFTGRVAINISARQFELPDLDQRIMRALRRAGLSPLHLECEITEGTLMQNPERALQMMQRLRDMGIHLALDDFGTGYSSLAYLKRFPLNTLKIDKAFIDDIATSAVDRHMTSAIITIAHNLGLKVVAEGVEEEQQLSILRRYECEMLQGYLYSKPLSAERFTRLLQENRQLSRLIKQNNL